MKNVNLKGIAMKNFNPKNNDLRENCIYVLLWDLFSVYYQAASKMVAELVWTMHGSV